MTVVDVLVTHPPGAAPRAAIATTGGGAEKRQARDQPASNGTPLAPFFWYKETYGCLEKQAVMFLRMLSAEVAATGNASKLGFVAAALQELSVGL
jgi:hypothetical protein